MQIPVPLLLVHETKRGQKCVQNTQDIIIITISAFVVATSSELVFLITAAQATSILKAVGYSF